MKSHSCKPLYRPMYIGGMAVIIAGGIALGSLGALAQSFGVVFAPPEPLDVAEATAIAAPSARARRCAECGVIESTREIELPDEKFGFNSPTRIAAGNPGAIKAKPVRNLEITVRLQDGSMRVITDANPAPWRRGERITIIAGAD